MHQATTPDPTQTMKQDNAMTRPLQIRLLLISIGACCVGVLLISLTAWATYKCVAHCKRQKIAGAYNIEMYDMIGKDGQDGSDILENENFI